MKTETKTAWTKTAFGYVSDCGRFSIRRNTFKRGSYVLTDKARRDVCVPEYLWTRTCSTVDSAKRKVEKILSGNLNP
jgi:hypothetical protein